MAPVIVVSCSLPSGPPLVAVVSHRGRLRERGRATPSRAGREIVTSSLVPTPSILEVQPKDGVSPG
jgi:hypothetical protein